MTCEEFERVLPELEGSSRSIEQEMHLKSCSRCSDLVSDLNAISQQARFLQSSEEPSPWVWNSIEVALRQEGLIRQPQRVRAQAPSPLFGWKLRWLVPLAAAFLIVFGVFVRQREASQLKVSEQQPQPASQVSSLLRPDEVGVMASDDQQLLNTVTARMPSMRAAYEANLRSVNAYIRDAEQSAHSDPNDEVAQQYLMNAYEQRAMVYEMALDRSLP
jgi:hypothetical protein